MTDPSGGTEDDALAELANLPPEKLARIKKRHEYFVDGSHFSYNYNFMLFVASLIASLGLVSNSSAIVISSMLISPIMGPVLAMAYGTTVTDWYLTRIAMRTELISLLVCIIMGAIIAACTGWTDLADDWLTAEMFTRGTYQNLLVALPIAFASGLAVAVSVLDEQSSSLVGVAISASLLPPACNAGILWVSYAFLVNDNLASGNYPDTDKTRDKFIEGGAVSLLLSVANIILIYIASVLAFRLKWKIQLKHAKMHFWNDLSSAQKLYHRSAYGPNNSEIAQYRMEIETSQAMKTEKEEREESGEKQDPKENQSETGEAAA